MVLKSNDKSGRIGGGVGVDTVTQYCAPGVACRGRTFYDIKGLVRMVRLMYSYNERRVGFYQGGVYFVTNSINVGAAQKPRGEI